MFEEIAKTQTRFLTVTTLTKQAVTEDKNRNKYKTKEVQEVLRIGLREPSIICMVGRARERNRRRVSITRETYSIS